MRKIMIIEHVSLDGLIQRPGGPDEDRDGDFKQGGWILPHSHPTAGEAIKAAHGKSFDVLLGRDLRNLGRLLAETERSGSGRSERGAAVKSGAARGRTGGRVLSLAARQVTPYVCESRAGFLNAE